MTSYLLSNYLYTLVYMYKTYAKCMSRCLKLERILEHSHRLLCSMMMSNRTDRSPRCSSYMDLYVIYTVSKNKESQVVFVIYSIKLGRF